MSPRMKLIEDSGVDESNISHLMNGTGTVAAHYKQIEGYYSTVVNGWHLSCMDIGLPSGCKISELPNSF